MVAGETLNMCDSALCREAKETEEKCTSSNFAVTREASGCTAEELTDRTEVCFARRAAVPVSNREKYKNKTKSLQFIHLKTSVKNDFRDSVTCNKGKSISATSTAPPTGIA